MTDFHINIHEGFGVASALRYASLAGIRFAGLVMACDGTQPRVMNWDTFVHQSPRIIAKEEQA